MRLACWMRFRVCAVCAVRRIAARVPCAVCRAPCPACMPPHPHVLRIQRCRGFNVRPDSSAFASPDARCRARGPRLRRAGRVQRRLHVAVRIVGRGRPGRRRVGRRGAAAGRPGTRAVVGLDRQAGLDRAALHDRRREPARGASRLRDAEGRRHRDRRGDRDADGARARRAAVVRARRRRVHAVLRRQRDAGVRRPRDRAGRRDRAAVLRPDGASR